jgi:hypothetical protein
MHDTIDLARSVIAGEHHVIIQLQRDIDSRRERGIVFIWPPAPTVIEPSRLAAVSTAIITGLGAARIELAAIRAAGL